MNTYKTSSGKRYTQPEIEKKIREAKKQLLQNQLFDFGYNFCEECGHNGSGTRLDCSHTISVKKAKENGQTELCWDVSNLRVLCREHHSEYDQNNLQWKK